MKILLIWPSSPDYCVLTEEFSCCEPLSLEYIAAGLLDDNEVDILDMRLDKDLVKVLSSKKYDAAAVAVPYTTNVKNCNKILKQISEFDNNIIKIIGGHYPSVTLSHLDLEFIDYVVVGEGVQTVKELIDGLKNNCDLENIQGIAVIRDKKAYYTEKRIFNNLDCFPFPARHLIKHNEKKYFHAHYKPVSLMRFSAGCPYQCSFCILWKMTDQKYITRSNELIIEEMNGISNQNIYVIDDEAFINIKKMDNLADLILKNKINKKFHMYLRSDTVIKNPSLFEKWSEAGLDSVLVGLESVFDEELSGYNKNISMKMAYEAVEILHNNNIEIRANFIIRPEYTKKHFDLVKKAFLDLDIDRPTFAVLTPFIGTDIYNEVKDQFIIDKLEFFDCYHTFLKTKLPIKEFYKEFADLFRVANSRCKNSNEEKVFYAGKGNSFENFVDKIEKSYIYYQN